MPYRRTGAVLVGGALMVAAAACAGSSEEPTGPRTVAEIPADASQVAFDPIEEFATAISAVPDRRRMVIRDERTWVAFWDEFAAAVMPRPDPPAIDFATRMVIVATMGQRSSGGYAISVEDVAEDDATLYARVQETSPGVGCMTATVMTAPAVAVSVPRHEGDVAFVETEMSMPCGP